MSAIRLAIARQRYNSYGGAERFVARVLDAFAHRGEISVTLLARDWPPATESSSRWQWQRVDPFYLGRAWRDWSFMRAVQKIAENYTILQSHERIPGATIFRAGDGVHAAWLEQYAKTQSALARLAVNVSPYHRLICAAEREMFAHPALRYVICNSRMVRDDIIRRFRVAEDKLVVIYNGIDTDYFSPASVECHRQSQRRAWGIPEDAPLLAVIGSGFLRKGLAVALNALSAHPSVFLLIVGSDKRQEHYTQLAGKAGVASRVRFLGALTDVRLVYGAADALILPTLYDPFPNVCIEALACGLPLLTSPTCGAAEWITEGENGWVIDALDDDGYRSAVGAWLESWGDPAARTSLKNAARATAVPHTLSAMTEILTNLYQRLSKTYNNVTPCAQILT
ncbi:MAG: glycosyltransferase family 4 protein [Burkholderiales bacterium]|jgi:UDP-glucose:(heptosyl)LPS alpha-1,3-glucosyltransferase|nr:glycosyltransferase family 4 protein [Burkholderiales bacterium]